MYSIPKGHCYIFYLVEVARIEKYGILLPRLFWPTVRKKWFSDQEKLLKFEAEGREFSNFSDH